MVVLVTPLSVAPVACPLPHGDGSVPNLAEEDDAAPPTPGEIRTPAAVSVVSISAAPRARKPVTLFIIKPPVARNRTRNRVLLRIPWQTLEHVPVLAQTLATRESEISAPAGSPQAVGTYE